MGYYRAGFDVVGVDVKAQPNYPFVFHQGDAMEFPLYGYDAVHASPPCQRYAALTAWRGDRNSHPDLLPPVLDRLRLSDAVWVVENVPEAIFKPDFLLCGTMFGLGIRRHRHFLASWRQAFGLRLNWCRHGDEVAFLHKQERAFADAMGCQWMSIREGRQAIPPAYTEWIGAQMLEVLT